MSECPSRIEQNSTTPSFSKKEALAPQSLRGVTDTRVRFEPARKRNNLEFWCACRWHRCRYSQRKETSVRPRFLLALRYRIGKLNLNYNRNYEISFRLR